MRAIDVTRGDRVATSTDSGSGVPLFDRRPRSWPGAEPINVGARCITTGISVVALLLLLLALIFVA
jgi:hypothetical protein